MKLLINNIRLFFVLTLFLFSFATWAQLDNLHYMAPLVGDESAGHRPEEQVVYITTPKTSSVNYTLEDGAGNVLQSGTVTNAVPATYAMHGEDTDFIVRYDQRNSVVSDKGLKLTATDSVYFNLRVLGGSSQAGSLTSKGKSGLGKNFRIFNTPLRLSGPKRNHTFGVMATEDGTTVEIDLTGTGVVFAGTGAPSTASVISVSLDAGDTYVVQAESTAVTANLIGMIGGKITSNKDIAFSTGSWSGTPSFISNVGQDVCIDQAVPAKVLGTEYIAVRANGPDDEEVIFIIAEEDNTSIFINGNTTALTTINAGDYYKIDGSNYINDAIYIETSEIAYVWQVLSGFNSNYTQGANALPPVSCLTPKTVDNIASIEQIGSKIFSGGINIFTLAGSTVTINGSSIGVLPTVVTGSGGYEYYQVTGLTGNVKVESNNSCIVGFFGANDNAGYGGYFSGFGVLPKIVNITLQSTCAPGIILASNTTFDSYQWARDGVDIPGATSSRYTPTTGGNYSLRITLGGCVATSQELSIDSCPLPENFMRHGKHFINGDEQTMYFGKKNNN